MILVMNKVASEKTTNDEQLNNSSVLVAECVNNIDGWTNEKESNLIVGEQYIVELAVIFSSRTVVKLKGMDRMFNSALFHFNVNGKPFSLIGDARPYLELHTDKYAYKGVTRIVKYKSATEESFNEIAKQYRCVPIIDRSTIG